MPRRGGLHSRHRAAPRRRVGLTTGVLAVAVGLVLISLRFVPGSPLAAIASGRPDTPRPTPSTAASRAASPSPSPSPSLPPLPVAAAPVAISTSGFWSWALMDQRTGRISGSRTMSSTNRTASMIKAWIAADYLRRTAERGQTPSSSRLEQVRIMIRDSDNAAASELYQVVGESASTRRMISLCRLTDSKPGPTSWSDTRVSARDTARMAACIADGRAAGPEWTDWLLKEMRLVRGVGDFGIRKAFPASVAKTIAIKNGWVVRDRDGNWEVNCLAIGDGWTMAVLTRYDASLGFAHGATICKNVAAQLRA